MVVALDDVLKIRRAILNKQHIKQEPEQIAGRVHHTPVPVDFTQAVEVHRVAEVVVHSQWGMNRVIGAHKGDR